jgi:hypothetical protein
MKLLQELLQFNEGNWVIKSIDGIEKRFKDRDSVEAKAWSSTVAKKRSAKKVKYSLEWWEEQELTPWSKISLGTDKGQLSVEILENLSAHSFNNIVDLHLIGKTFEQLIDNIPCAHTKLTIMVAYSKDDDLGLADDTMDSYTIIVRRDMKDPTKFVFVKFM